MAPANAQLSVLSLPNELQHEILSYLSFDGYLVAAQVCRYWRVLVQHGGGTSHISKFARLWLIFTEKTQPPSAAVRRKEEAAREKICTALATPVSGYVWPEDLKIWAREWPYPPPTMLFSAMPHIYPPMGTQVKMIQGSGFVIDMLAVEQPLQKQQKKDQCKAKKSKGSVKVAGSRNLLTWTEALSLVVRFYPKPLNQIVKEQRTWEREVDSLHNTLGPYWANELPTTRRKKPTKTAGP